MRIHTSNSYAILLTTIFCITACCNARDEISLYRKVEHQSLVALAWEDEDWPNENLYDFLTRCMHYQRNPNLIKKRRAAFKIICPCLEQEKSTVSNILDDTKTWTDLCLFHGQQDIDQSLVNIIDRTHTELGKTMLACMLVRPTDNHEELSYRQHIIKELVENESLLAQLDTALNEFSRTENIMISFWLHDLLQHTAERHFYNIPRFKDINDTLNKSVFALDIKTMVQRTTLTMGLLSNVAACVVLPIYALSRLNLFEAPKNFVGAARGLKGTAGSLFVFITRWLKAKQVDAMVSLVAGGYCALSVKDSYELARDNVFLDQCLQEKMITAADCWQSIKKVADTLKNTPTLHSSMLAAYTLNEFIYVLPHESDDLMQLFELLATPTFKGTSSFFCRTGRVLTAYCLMHGQKKLWVKALTAIAELDAYVSIAKLYKEFEHREHGYCFAEFIKDRQPVCQMVDFWNPFIKDSIISNSITLNNEHRLNGILTGPNAGGKSTILRGMAINVILAQSFGIAAARRMILTPFSSIATYLNISDDITVGNSLFKAEVLRVQSLLDRVAKLHTHQFSFIVIDEMFGGTPPCEGEAASYSVAKHLGLFKNNVCMMATPFSMLTKLEQDTLHFINYKVAVDPQQDGTIRYPYKLERGISDQHVAIDILQAQGFTNTILQEARDLVRITAHRSKTDQ